MNDFPKELVEITDFLATQTELAIQGSGQDKRRDSAEIEIKIINLLKNQKRWKIEDPNYQKGIDTSWYDLGVTSQNHKKLFVRIKISSLKSADNTGCIGGFYYVLTGKTPPSDKSNTVGKLKINLRKNEKNYYFLIIKKPTKNNKNFPKSFLCSLRTLKEINPSGDNLPFQCHWGKNIEPSSYRSYKEICNFLLKTYGKSLKLRADRYTDFKECFPCMVVSEEKGRNAKLDV